MRKDEFAEIYAAGARELESKYLIPVFWLALFEANDVREGNLLKASVGARATLARRRSGRARFIGSTAPHSPPRFAVHSPACDLRTTLTYKPSPKAPPDFDSQLAIVLEALRSDLDDVTG